MADNAKLEIRLFHLIVSVMGFLLLGVVGFIAINSTHIPIIESQLAGVIVQYNTQAATISEHDHRIQRLEDMQDANKKTPSR